MYNFELIEYEKLQLNEFNSYIKKPLFTTKQWLDFIIEDSKAEPAIFRITRGNEFLGYVPVLFVKKLGVKIAGSPFRGWSTCWMGVEVSNSNEKIGIIKELSEVLFKKYKCIYFEIVDRYIEEKELETSGLSYYMNETLELDIQKTDDELWKVFKTDCRNYIRQFERRGAILQEVKPSDEFAEEYYSELKDVFAKQGMKPTYSCEKVKCLFRHINKEEILCLRVISPEGEPVATSIFLADKYKAYFWGGASYREHQHYRPNEFMIWYAIKYWRERKIEIFDMVGNRKYKQKFGPVVKTYASIQIAKYRWLIQARNMAERLYFLRLKKRSNK